MVSKLLGKVVRFFDEAGHLFAKKDHPDAIFLFGCTLYYIAAELEELKNKIEG